MSRRRPLQLLRREFLGAGLLLAGGSLVRCRSESTPAQGTTTGAGGAASSSSTAGVGGAATSTSTTSGQGGMGGVQVVPSGSSGAGGAGGGAPSKSLIGALGPLQAADANGVRLPAGFTSRIVARSGELVPGGSYTWHSAPDGGAVFATSDGGWIYVSNSERSFGQGGVGALRFSPAGEVVGGASILSGTSRNCAGGPTPWGTWLSCEEYSSGRVWECSPTGATSGVVHPALGVFNHEAVAVDTIHNHLYLTEDEGSGRLYRYVPDRVTGGVPDLQNGKLQVATVDGAGQVTWTDLPDPSAGIGPTRYQVPGSTAFAGGEGIWFHQGVVTFTTKGDNRVWALDVTTQTLTVLYDAATSATPILTGVDNVVVSPAGDVLVAEDGGNLEIVAIAPGGAILPIVQLVGHDDSEIAGPAFDPSLTRLYFSSQRGTTGSSNDGVTFEITGPFFG